MLEVWGAFFIRLAVLPTNLAATPDTHSALAAALHAHSSGVEVLALKHFMHLYNSGIQELMH
jgi:hypothetical protein